MITGTIRIADTYGVGSPALDALARQYGFTRIGTHLYTGNSDLQAVRTRVELFVRQLQHYGYRILRYKVSMLLVDSDQHDEFKLGVAPEESF